MKYLMDDMDNFEKGKMMNIPDLEDWEKLTKEQQQGITAAVEEIDKGKGIAHQKVLDNIRKKYTNA